MYKGVRQAENKNCGPGYLEFDRVPRVPLVTLRECNQCKSCSNYISGTRGTRGTVQLSTSYIRYSTIDWHEKYFTGTRLVSL